MEGFPPETVGRSNRQTPARDQAGYQAPQSASEAGAALEDGGALDAILAKLIAAPATAANQATIITALALLATKLDTANGLLTDIKTNTTPP